LRVLFYFADRRAQGFYRCFIPGKYMERYKLAEVRFRNQVFQSDICWADIVVFQRQHEDNVFFNFMKIKLQNKAVVYEVDDFLHGISPKSPAYRTFNPSHQAWNGSIQFLKAASAITVTRQPLKEEYSVYNSNVYVLPNFMDLDMWKNAEKKDNGDIVKVSWSGSTTHYEDLAEIVDVLEDIVRDYPKVMLRFTGYFPERLFSRIPKDRVEVGMCYPFEQYYKVIEPADINITPIVNTRFNESKSAIKYLEASMLGIPTVASKVGPYKDAITHGQTGFLAKRYSDWYKHLATLIENESLRKQIGKNAKEQWTFDSNIWRWRKAYEEILEKERCTSEGIHG
jgi:glycosyltransferase involved in cell wall biosynthesis